MPVAESSSTCELCGKRHRSQPGLHPWVRLCCSVPIKGIVLFDELKGQPFLRKGPAETIAGTTNQMSVQLDTFKGTSLVIMGLALTIKRGESSPWSKRCYPWQQAAWRDELSTPSVALVLSITYPWIALSLRGDDKCTAQLLRLFQTGVALLATRTLCGSASVMLFNPFVIRLKDNHS